MKKIIITMVTLLITTVGAKAMSYEQAREQALFLTDKMAYELNLSQEQYEAAYEINLDYLMSVNTVDDLYSVYWRQRNYDMQAIFYDWQWTAFCAASYFYRPLYWDAGVWHFSIYAHYPHRDIFYFSRPVVWASYRGGHSWRYNGGRSWWADRGPSLRPVTHHGMRHHAPHHVGGTHHGAPHHTAPAPRHDSHSRGGNFGRNASPRYGGHHTGSYGTSTPNSSMRTRESSTRTTVGERPTAPSSGNSPSSSSFGRNHGGHTGSGSSVGSRSSFGGHSSMGSSHMGGGSRSSSSMGGSHSGGYSGGHSGGGHSGGARGGRR